MKLPYLKLYTGDWLKDPKLSFCKPLSRGVWIDLICAMHELDQCGELRGTTEQLARIARCSTLELDQALTDIQARDAGKVTERNGEVTVVCRRMKREFLHRKGNAERQSRYRKVTVSNREQKPDTDNEDEGLQRVREFARGKGILESDADWFFWKCQGNGWTNSGQPIRDWKATLLCWWRAGYVPSKRNGSNGQRSMSAYDIQKRSEAITEKINRTYKENGHKRVDGDGIDELKQRRDELQKQLLI